MFDRNVCCEHVRFGFRSKIIIIVLCDSGVKYVLFDLITYHLPFIPEKKNIILVEYRFKVYLLIDLS